MSARARYKFKRTSKLVSEVRRHEYEDTRMNKGVRVKRYKGERRQGLENKSTSSKVQVKGYQAYEYMRTKT